MKWGRPVLATLAALFFLLAAPAARGAQDLCYSLPTENTALYHGGKDAYFMYCEREFEGKKSQPWQAGTYGLVRHPLRLANGKVVYARMHEGIDIKPMRRDADGEPLDPVRAIAPGTVAYTCTDPGLSNYGRYVVVAHEVPEGTIYSLYAHLASVSCKVGQRVDNRSRLGILGHSGVGLDCERAHCHLEIGFMVNAAYDKICPTDNEHGIFNGKNLIGFNPADILLASKGGRPVSISRYIARLPEHYRVRVPRVGTMDLLRRHRFFYKGVAGKRPAPPSLDIAFTAEGVPIAVYPAQEQLSEPRIISCKPMPVKQQNATVNRVKNTSRDAELTPSGQRYITHYLWLEGRYPFPQPAAVATTPPPAP